MRPFGHSEKSQQLLADVKPLPAEEMRRGDTERNDEGEQKDDSSGEIARMKKYMKEENPSHPFFVRRFS
jgi:hypothetical protein